MTGFKPAPGARHHPGPYFDDDICCYSNFCLLVFYASKDVSPPPFFLSVSPILRCGSGEYRPFHVFHRSITLLPPSHLVCISRWMATEKVYWRHSALRSPRPFCHISLYILALRPFSSHHSPVNSSYSSSRVLFSAPSYSPYSLTRSPAPPTSGCPPYETGQRAADMTGDPSDCRRTPHGRGERLSHDAIDHLLRLMLNNFFVS